MSELYGHPIAACSRVERMPPLSTWNEEKGSQMTFGSLSVPNGGQKAGRPLARLNSRLSGSFRNWDGSPPPVSGTESALTGMHDPAY